MRVGMYYSNKDVRVEEKPVPKIGPGEALVKIHASGICGSDLMEWYRAGRVPVVLGHEVAGEVVEAGEGVEACKSGDRVSVTHHVPCLNCHYCRTGHETTCDTLRRTNFDPGGFSEFVRLPAINVRLGMVKLPDNVSYEEGSMVEPVGCVVRGLRMAGFRPGQTVLVIGTGASGLLYVDLSFVLGAGRVFGVDRVPKRLEAARSFGAVSTFEAGSDVPVRLRSLNDGRLADLVILCAGAPEAISESLQCVERGGTVLFSAPCNGNQPVSIPFNDLFWRNEITLTSTYGSAPFDSNEALSLIRSGRLHLKNMITHRLGLGDIGKGFQLAAEARDALKVMIDPQR